MKGIEGGGRERTTELSFAVASLINPLSRFSPTVRHRYRVETTLRARAHTTCCRNRCVHNRPRPFLDLPPRDRGIFLLPQCHPLLTRSHLAANRYSAARVISCFASLNARMYRRDRREIRYGRIVGERDTLRALRSRNREISETPRGEGETTLSGIIGHYTQFPARRRRRRRAIKTASDVY